MLKTILYILVLMTSSLSYGDVFSLRDIYMDFHQYGMGSRNPLIDFQGDRVLDKEVSVYFNTDMFNIFYFDNKILGLVDKAEDNDDSRFRVVGWNFDIGLRLSSWAHIEYEHFSKHVLDRGYNEMYPGNKFPVEDSIGLKLFFYRRDKAPKSLF